VAAQAGSGARRSQWGPLSCGRASWGPGGAGRAAKGQLAARKTPAMGGGRRCRETEMGKQEEEDEDLKSKIFLLNYRSNEHTPKIKSAELKKIYHFVLGSNFKRVRVLKLFLKANKSFNLK
jgi:hypothetical protein